MKHLLILIALLVFGCSEFVSYELTPINSLVTIQFCKDPNLHYPGYYSARVKCGHYEFEESLDFGFDYEIPFQDSIWLELEVWVKSRGMIRDTLVAYYDTTFIFKAY